MRQTEVRIELQLVDRRPEELAFHAPELGIDVLVNRSAVHDLGNLEALIIVVPGTEIRDQRSIEQRVLRTHFKRVKRFRCKGKREDARNQRRRIETAIALAT